MSSRPWVNGATRVFCLIGNPVNHSISPQMYNKVFQSLGLNCVYIAFQVEETDLEEAVEGLKALGVSGFNVTIPHKTPMLKLIDEVDSGAQKIGAVNVVVREGDRLIGYNTDVDGVEYAFTKAGVSPNAKRITLLGAGGAARAVIAYFVKAGCKEVYLLNRSLKRALRLAEEAKRDWGLEVTAAPLSTEDLKRFLRESEIVVNATPLGMHPKKDETPVPKELIEGDHVVFDVVYTPIKTRLLKDSEDRGARVIRGLDMLVGQGLRAFELFTGLEAPRDVMEKAAVSALGDMDEE